MKDEELIMWESSEELNEISHSMRSLMALTAPNRDVALGLVENEVMNLECATEYLEYHQTHANDADSGSMENGTPSIWMDWIADTPLGLNAPGVEIGGAVRFIGLDAIKTEAEWLNQWAEYIAKSRPQDFREVSRERIVAQWCRRAQNLDAIWADWKFLKCPTSNSDMCEVDIMVSEAVGRWLALSEEVEDLALGAEDLHITCSPQQWIEWGCDDPLTQYVDNMEIVDRIQRDGSLDDKNPTSSDGWGLFGDGWEGSLGEPAS